MPPSCRQPDARLVSRPSGRLVGMSPLARGWQVVGQRPRARQLPAATARRASRSFDALDRVGIHEMDAAGCFGGGIPTVRNLAKVWKPCTALPGVAEDCSCVALAVLGTSAPFQSPTPPSIPSLTPPPLREIISYGAVTKFARGNFGFAHALPVAFVGRVSSDNWLPTALQIPRFCRKVRKQTDSRAEMSELTRRKRWHKLWHNSDTEQCRMLMNNALREHEK